MKYIFSKWILTLGCYFLISSLAAADSLKTSIASKFLVRGERTLFEITVEGTQLRGAPIIANQDGLSIEPLQGPRRKFAPGRKVAWVYQYIVSSYQTGKVTIPSAEVSLGSVMVKSEPIQITIIDPSELIWQTATPPSNSAAKPFRYASMIHLNDTRIYENQTVASEMKIYIPSEIARTTVDWGVPEYEKDGFAAWRYEPSQSKSEVNLLGAPYIAMSYKSSVTALRDGQATIGPATVRLTYMETVFQRSLRRLELQATLQINSRGVGVLALPENAPEGFQNAVGQFSIETAIKETKINEGEPLAIDLIVSGSGNLDTLKPPTLLDDTGWKVYEATAKQRGNERREVSGSVTFNQFLRPLQMKQSIPPFKLIYFDPKQEIYKTVITEPVSIQMELADFSAVTGIAAPQALPLPIERMNDILGVLPDSLNAPQDRLESFWRVMLWIALALAVWLLALAVWRRFPNMFTQDPAVAKIKSDLADLSETKRTDSMTFIKKAASFVEKYLPESEDEKVRAVIKKRDEYAFRQTSDSLDLSKKQRREMLRLLKKSALSLLVFSAILIGFNERGFAEEERTEGMAFYEEGDYPKAMKSWLERDAVNQLPADTLYNIGNAAYRSGLPGFAALYYRRALLENSAHAEALQNLRFIERKFGSIVVSRPDYQFAFTWLSIESWKRMLYVGGWIIVLGYLATLAFQRGQKRRVAGFCGIILGLLIVLSAALGLRFFPDDSQFATVKEQAVIIYKESVLYTEAARTSPEVIDAPVGSIAQVITRSGDWAYVAFATKTRGWIHSERIRMLLIDGKADVPKIKKSEADENSA